MERRRSWRACGCRTRASRADEGCKVGSRLGTACCSRRSWDDLNLGHVTAQTTAPHLNPPEGTDLNSRAETAVATPGVIQASLESKSGIAIGMAR
jgi:hypothetical protein